MRIQESEKTHSLYLIKPNGFEQGDVQCVDGPSVQILEVAGRIWSAGLGMGDADEHELRLDGAEVEVLI